jgi:transcriptional regulator with XRE-family HTH domain
MTDHEVADRETVAGEVRGVLARQRITVNRLPRLIGKSQSYWHRRISGELALDVDDLSALASVLEVPVSSFFVVRREGLEPPTRWISDFDELAALRARKAAAVARKLQVAA